MSELKRWLLCRGGRKKLYFGRGLAGKAHRQVMHFSLVLEKRIASKVASIRSSSTLMVECVISPQDEMVCEIYFIIILWRRRHKTKTTT